MPQRRAGHEYLSDAPSRQPAEIVKICYQIHQELRIYFITMSALIIWKLIFGVLPIRPLWNE